jgi:1,2-dihydroxy-3-keto-5-methylthiopentene dioxygenase
MATLFQFNSLPNKGLPTGQAKAAANDAILTLTDAGRIRDFLAVRGIFFEQWEAPCVFAPDASPEDVLAAYEPVLTPYMARNGYRTADVIIIHPAMAHLDELRAKFRREHTHTEDEVRFFVEGWGDFWFNLPDRAEGEDADGRDNRDNGNNDIFCVRCEAGDLLAVPAGFRHWFDMGPEPRVKTIRIFTDASGWTPHYTDSGVEAAYALPPGPLSGGKA